MARTKTTKTTKTAARKTPTITGRISRKGRGEILGLPIEDMDHIAQGYPDTEGEQLSDPIEDASQEQQLAADQAEIAGRKPKGAAEVAKPRVSKQSPLFQGTIPCTRLFKQDLTEKFAAKQRWHQGTRVEVANWMLLNEVAATVTYCNTYHGSPRASFNPDTYTYPLTGWAQKQATKKMELFTEIEDREEWPTWTSSAVPMPKAEKTPAKKARKGK